MWKPFAPLTVGVHTNAVAWSRGSTGRAMYRSRTFEERSNTVALGVNTTTSSARKDVGRNWQGATTNGEMHAMPSEPGKVRGLHCSAGARSHLCKQSSRCQSSRMLETWRNTHNNEFRVEPTSCRQVSGSTRTACSTAAKSPYRSPSRLGLITSVRCSATATASQPDTDISTAFTRSEGDMECALVASAKIHSASRTCAIVEDWGVREY